MIYYPLVQVLSRVPSLWYEPLFGPLTDNGTTTTFASVTIDNQGDETVKTIHTISNFLYVLTLPAAGIGFFFVFIFVTPGAYDKTVELILEVCYMLRCFPRPEAPDPTIDPDIVAAEPWRVSARKSLKGRRSKSALDLSDSMTASTFDSYRIEGVPSDMIQ